MEDENFKLDLELLHGFVSQSIFDFLSSIDSSVSTSHLINEQAPPASTDAEDHVPLDNHILPGVIDVAVASASANVHVSESFPDILDAHIEALSLACSQQYEEEEEEQASKRMKLDSTTGSSSKWPFAVPKSEEEIAKAKLSAVPEKTLADTKYCIGVWNQWCDHRHAVHGDIIPPIAAVYATTSNTSLQFCFWGEEENRGRISTPKPSSYC